jgi:anti-sigma B factor antagonist
MLLRLVVEAGDGHALVTAAGELDVSNAGNLTSAVQAAFSDGFAAVVVDLQRVTFLDSSGARALVNCDRSARQAGGRFAVVASRPQVRRSLTLLGLDLSFPVFDSVSDALAEG